MSVHTLAALGRHFEAIRRAELTRLEPKCSALSPEARTLLEEITRLIVETLLVTPNEQLESVGDEAIKVRHVAVLNRLFQVTVDDRSPVAALTP